MVSIQPIAINFLGSRPENQPSKEVSRPTVRRKTIDERLQDFFVNSRIKERRPLENFRGDRKIEAYRGKGFINKITIKLPTETTPKLELIRNMKDVTAKGDKIPKYLDQATVFIADDGRGMVQVFYKVLGDSTQGLKVKIFRIDHQSVIRTFENFAQMRKDKYIMGLIGKMAKKKLIK